MAAYIISSNRLYLRQWLPTDIAPFAAMNKDPDVMRYFPNLLTESETAAMVKRIQNHFDDKGFGLFALEKKQTGAFIGFTGFAVPRFESFFTPCVEIGWRLQKKAWGQGFATEAATACLAYGFKELRFEKVVSFTSTLNTTSENVMKKIEMNKVALFDHPLIDIESPLCRHVLYEVKSTVKQ